MYEIGEYIVYGNAGVCKVVETVKMPVPGTKDDKLYYTLDPVYDKGCRLFVPVDSQKVKMRPILTKKEADLHLAEENLYGELSVVMGIPKNEMGEYISSRVMK